MFACIATGAVCFVSGSNAFVPSIFNLLAVG